jgi:hypothetical protein
MSFERALRAHGGTVKRLVCVEHVFECCAKFFRKTNELRGVSSIAIGTAAVPSRSEICRKTRKARLKSRALRLSDCYIQNSRLKGAIVPCFRNLYLGCNQELRGNWSEKGY